METQRSERGTSGSQTWRASESPGGRLVGSGLLGPTPAVSDSATLGKGPRIHISNKLQVILMLLVQGHFENHWDIEPCGACKELSYILSMTECHWRIISKGVIKSGVHFPPSPVEGEQILPLIHYHLDLYPFPT